MRQVGKVCLAFLLMVSWALGQSSAGSRASTKKAPSVTSPSVTSRLEQMEKALEAQQHQITQLQDELKSRDSQVQQLQQQLTQTQSSVSQVEQNAQAAAAKSVQPEQLDALKKDIADIQGVATNSALSLQETQKSIKEAGSPLALHYRGITITPGGFLVAESVYRNRAMGSDINTPFNAVSMPGSSTNRISEFFGSGRQSRISMLAEGKLSDVKLTGYYESDFLSAGVTSNNNQSNSYTLRQRQVWGQAAWTNGWSVTGGQMWSLVTETKKGVDNRTEALPMTIDAQYHVGFSWARQYGVRLAKNFGNRLWLAASLENPQTLLAAANNASNFAFGSPGVGGGLYNLNANYSFNATPDVIVKAAFEPGFGHYEIFGIFSRFRDRVYPCEDVAATTLCGGSTTAGPNALQAFNSSKNAGGVGANARVTVAKRVDFGLHALYGNGVGRYGTSTLPDATVNPDGTLAPLRSYQGLATLEWHSPRLDVYLNGGEEYVARRYQIDPVTHKTVGYGAPSYVDSGCYTETVPSAGSGYAFGSVGSCSGNTQSLVEGTFGFWVRLYNGPKGRLQIGPQYSYLVRNAWTGTFAAATPTTPAIYSAPHGVENMVLTSFRYYLP